MPTTTKTKTTEATRAANAPDAAELFKKGQRLLAGQNPTSKKSSEVQPAAAPKPDFTGIPAQIADFVADMIVHGSSRDALDLIIYGCLEHQYRSFDFAQNQSREEFNEGTRDWVGKHTDAWRDALVAFRQARKRIPEAERPKPVTASERIRAAAKDNLRDRVLDFVNTSSPEDTQLLTNVLEDFEAQRATWKLESSKESPLASGFEYALGSNKTYIRVPRHLADHIASYANALVNAIAVPEVQANA